MSKLKYLPSIDDMTERYRTHVQGVAESYRTAGLANASKKEEEVSGETGSQEQASGGWRERERGREGRRERGAEGGGE